MAGDGLMPGTPPLVGVPLVFGAPDAGAAAAVARVLLLDAARLTRDCLLRVLRERAPHLAIAGAASPAEAPAGGADVVLLNIHGAAPNDPAVLALLAELASLCNDPAIVFIAQHVDSRAVIAALRHRVRGFFPTVLGADALVAVIGLVLAGGSYIPEGVIGGAAPPPQVPCGLTRRELDVFGLLCVGKPNKIIAHELAMSEGTVKVHVRNILKKLGVANRTQIASLGHQRATLADRS